MAEFSCLQRLASSDRTPNSPTFGRLLNGGDASKFSPSLSPTSKKDHDQDEDHSPLKKSLLAKMKMKAKKLQHSLSHKKKQTKEDEDNKSMLSTGVSVKLEDFYEDVDGGEGDPEYLGAPMYESEMAPKELKGTVRQHTQADPMVFESHYLSMPPKNDFDQEDNKSNPNQMAIKTVMETQEPYPKSPSKTLRETMTEKLAPAYSVVIDATHAITSKIQGLTVSVTTAQEPDKHVISNTNEELQAEIKSSASKTKFTNSSGQVWDKGVSMREYIMQKFKPGEDERALSQVISQAISPQENVSDISMVGRMKDTLSSFLWNEESKCPTAMQSALNSPSKNPTSMNMHEAIVAKAEAHGRILQAN